MAANPSAQTVDDLKRRVMDSIDHPTEGDEVRMDALIAAAYQRGRDEAQAQPSDAFALACAYGDRAELQRQLTEAQAEIARLTAEYHELQSGAIGMNAEAIRERLRAEAAERQLTAVEQEARRRAESRHIGLIARDELLAMADWCRHLRLMSRLSLLPI